MVSRNVAIMLYYCRDCKYSVYSLISTLESKVKDVDVYIADRKTFFKVYSNVVNKYRWVIAGFSFMTTMLPSLLNFLKNVFRFKRSNTIFIAGGSHPSGDPVGTLDLGFDYVFAGEAEHSIVNFVNSLVEGSDVFKVRGVVYRDESGENVFTGKPKLAELDDYPAFPYWRRMFNPIEISRGCPFRCTYCQVPFLHGFYMRHRSIDNILHYARIFWGKGLRDLRFISPNSLAYGTPYGSKPSPEILDELLSKLKTMANSYGGRFFYGTFPSEVRPDFVNEDTAMVLKKYVSNKKVIIGAQSGSDKMLKFLNRGHTVEEVLNAMEVLSKYGFQVDVDFIFGLPGETGEDIEETIKVMEKIVKMGGRIHTHTFLPLPGSPLESGPPGKIPLKIKKFVMKICGKGMAYGDWLKQEKLAETIDELRKKHVIKIEMKNKIRVWKTSKEHININTM